MPLFQKHSLNSNPLFTPRLTYIHTKPETKPAFELTQTQNPKPDLSKNYQENTNSKKPKKVIKKKKKKRPPCSQVLLFFGCVFIFH